MEPQGCEPGSLALPGLWGRARCLPGCLQPVAGSGSLCSAGICSCQDPPAALGLCLCPCELPWGQQCPLSLWVLQWGWQDGSQPDSLLGNGIDRIVPAEEQGHTQSCWGHCCSLAARGCSEGR